MPGKQWEDEESSSAESSPKVGAVRRKFDDEEAEDSDVLESWDAAEDSEVEREKAKKAAEAKAKADAEAAARKKSKKQRILEHQAERSRRAAEKGIDTSDEEETEAERRERLRATEKEADLRHAEDLFGDLGLGTAATTRKTAGALTVVPIDPKDPNTTIDLAALPLLNPATKTQFEATRNALVALLAPAAKKPHYALFLQEFSKQLAKDLPSDQIKKIASTLTTLSNEKLKEEKAAEKGGKKSKAQKTKSSLAIGRTNQADTAVYEDTFGDDDFM